MWDDIKRILMPIAPIIGSALGGPLAGAAITALEGVFNTTDPQQLTTSLLNANSEQQLAIRKADQDFQIAIQTIANKRLEIQDNNIDDAREREVELAKIDPKANWPLYAFIYGAITVWMGLNLSILLTTAFIDTVKNLDFLCVGSVLTYLFGLNSNNK